MAEAETEVVSEMTQIKISIVLFIASGILAFVVLFIFVKRQISRYTLRSKKGPHSPIGQDAPKFMRAEIERLLNRTKQIVFEPKLILDDVAAAGGGADVFRMKTVDGLKTLESELDSVVPGGGSGRMARSAVRPYLTAYRGDVLAALQPATVLDSYIRGYETARYALGEYTERDYQENTELLKQLISCVRSYKQQQQQPGHPSTVRESPRGGGISSHRLPSHHQSQPQHGAKVVYRAKAGGGGAGSVLINPGLTATQGDHV